MANSKKHSTSGSADSFISGVGSLLSVFSSHYHGRVVKKLCVSDMDALNSDWKAIGSDFKKSMRKAELLANK